jgi:hypothetical protein
MRRATFDGVIVDGEIAEGEGADVFCSLTSIGNQHLSGQKGKCVCCEIGYECIEMSVLGDMTGRFVYHALQLSRGKIDMVIDN